MPKSSRTGQGRIAHHVTDSPTTVTAVLEKHFNLAPEKIAELFELGAIYSNRLRVLEDRDLKKGDYLRIHLQPKRFPVGDVDWSNAVVADTRDYLVARKPAGIPAHATLDNQKENLLAELRRRTGHVLLVTQRLDTPVAGLMVLAKTPDFQRRFNGWLSNRQVEKRYRALTEIAPPLGLHVHYMEPSEYGAKKLSAEAKPSWLRCELTIHQVDEITVEEKRYYDVSVELHTGRTHQIRAQFAALGASIAGDRLYGSRIANPGASSRRETIGLFSSIVAWPAIRGQAPRYEVQPPWQA